MKAAEFIAAKLDGRKPFAGIVLGSGLGKLADKIENPTVIPYKDIPGFPLSTAVGHKGNFIAGELGGKFVVAMQGRFHYYEGYPMELVTLPIRVMKVLGIQYLFVSNAAGGVNYDFKVGDLTRPYDPSLRAKAFEIADQLGITLKQGVYFAGTGPSYETPAEYKYFRLIGADVVGMSTIPEVIVARHSDIPVFGMSVITNEAHDDYAEDFANDADDVVEAADAAADKMTALFTEIIASL